MFVFAGFIRCKSLLTLSKAFGKYNILHCGRAIDFFEGGGSERYKYKN
jgi:hypothetical protein